MAIDLSQIKTRPNTQKKNSESIFKRELSLFKGIRNVDKELFYRELAVLLSSGLDLKSSFEILIDQYQKRKKLKNTLETISLNTIKGKSVRESFELTGDFSEFELINLRIGEETKNLEAVLNNLAAYFQSKIELKRQLISLLTYPVIILVITIAVLYFMLNMVVPMFSKIFLQFGAELPFLTRKILHISENMNVYLYCILAFSTIVIIANRFISNNPTLLKVRERLTFKLPVFGALLKAIALNRFCKSMSLLLNSKVQLPEALRLCSDIMEKQIFREALTDINKQLLRGKTLSEAMSTHTVFDKKLITMLSVAEKSNALDEMFENISKQLDKDVIFKAKLIGTVLEPMIIIIIGIIVGTIMISMYAPMFDLSKIINTR